MIYSCKICRSENQEAIEALLEKKVTYRSIAKNFLKDFDSDFHLLEQSIGNHHKRHMKQKLSADDIEFLDRLQRGEVSLDEASRVVAVKVFKRMLENPNDVRFIDFFRAELLRLKQEENKVKEVWGKEIIARFFAGKLPPKYCPHCGKLTVDDSIKSESIVEEIETFQEPKLLNG